MFGATSRMITEVWYQSCDDEGASHMTTEVGGGASHTMKVCGATESILINSTR